MILPLPDFHRSCAGLEARDTLGDHRFCVLWMIACGWCATRSDLAEHFSPDRWVASAVDSLILYRFRKAWRNGKTAVVMDPMTFLSRLAAQVPPRRFQMLSHYGVLGPAAARRDEIVPGYREDEVDPVRRCRSMVKAGDSAVATQPKQADGVGGLDPAGDIGGRVELTLPGSPEDSPRTPIPVPTDPSPTAGPR